jgi:hypothetical protein
VDAIIEDVWHLDALADVSGLMSAHQGPASAVQVMGIMGP